LETLVEIAAALAAGNVTARGLAERSVARIRRYDTRFNAFVALDESGALGAADESDRRRKLGQARSGLDGAPISIKDNLHVGGLPSTWGSRGLAGFIAKADELPVARLRAAGAVILGKTNVPEFTLEGYTRNDLFGVTRNPWSVELTPGGSSGGAAASVAAGFVAAGLGTDGGGSIRRPACHTGLVGFKPSVGRWPRIDGFPAILGDFETAGTLTRTVEDALLLDALLKGADPRDRRSLYVEAPRWGEETRRILYVPRFGASPVDPEIVAATDALAQQLADAGHSVEAGDVFFDLDEAAHIWRAVSRAGVAWLMRENPGFEAKAGAAARAMADDGRTITGVDYLDALEKVAALRRRVAELFERFDLVLTPTAAALPWPAATPYPERIDGKPAGPRDHAIFTGWVNIAGLPAISLPVGLSHARLPIGAQFVAGFGADASLLDFSAALEAAMPAPPLPMLDH
jgi:aspartyl-tRNA(Asn)/glutamyl-tRNA(Gln) amidotransferase subunit A